MTFILSGNGMDPGVTPIRRNVNGAAPFFLATKGDMEIWENRSAAVIDTPTVEIGNFIFVCVWSIGNENMTSSTGVWTQLNNMTGFPAKVWYRKADGTANDVFTVRAFSQAGAAQMIVFATSVIDTLGPGSYNGNTLGGAPQTTFLLAGQVDGGSTDDSLVITLGGRWISGTSTGPYTFAGPDADWTLIDGGDQQVGGSTFMIVAWAYAYQENHVLTPSNNYNQSPNITGSVYGNSKRLDMNR